MKIINKMLFVLSVLFFVFLSCDNTLNEIIEKDNQNLAYIKIGNNTFARTIQPDFNVENMSDFVLSGIKDGSSEEIIIIQAASYEELMSFDCIAVESGKWSFTLTAKDEEIPLSGTITMPLYIGSVTVLSFKLTVDEDCISATSGSINIELELSYESNIKGVKAGLFNVDEDEFYDFKLESLEVKNDNRLVTYIKTEVPAGEYLFKAKFYSDSEYYNYLNTYESIVKVIAGKTSKDLIYIPTFGKAHSIKFVLNGGEFVNGYVPPKDFMSSTSTVLPDSNNIKKTGYVFAGWALDSYDGNKIKSLRNLDRDVTLYAKWQYGKVVTPEDALILDLSTEYGELEIKAIGDFTGAYFTRLSAAINLYNYPIILDLSEVTGIRGIPDEAFKNCKNLTSVILPDGVVGIGKESFYGCSNLTSIEIPTSLTNIDSSAFTSCYGLSRIDFSGSLSEWLNKNWKTNSVSNYYDLYIEGQKLTELVIPDGVMNIYSNTFNGCRSITNISIPNSITIIEKNAFVCSGVTAINYNGTLEQWCLMERKSGFGSSSYDLYINGEKIIDLVIPNTITSIGNYAFYGCSGITNITISDNVTDIGEFAFSGCSGITNITISDSVTDIGGFAFSGCTGLTSIIIPNSVTNIGNYIFDNCSNLEELTIPFLGNTVDAVSPNYIPSSIKKITISGGEIFGGVFSNTYNKNENLTTVTLLSGVTRIGKNAFFDCIGLTSVTIPDSVSSIDDYAFCNCTKLTAVSIPTGVTTIGEYAFYNCIGLTSVTISSNVSNIGRSAFNNCSSLKSISIPDGVTIIRENTFRNCTGLLSISIPSSISSIDNSAFYDCLLEELTISFLNLRKFSIPVSKLKKVTVTGGEIIDKAFENCKYLNSVTFLGEITSIGNSAFSGCKELTEIEISNGVKRIGAGAFRDCTGLKRVTIPEGVESIGIRAFSGCSALTSITIPEGVTSIGDGIFSLCTGLTEVKIYEGITSIGDEAFYGCSSLTSITIPHSVTNIVSFSFAECTSLTNVTLLDGVKSIGNLVFEGCIGLTSITIPETVTRLGEGVFRLCSNLSSVVFESPDNWYTGNRLVENLNDASSAATYLLSCQPLEKKN